MNNLFNKNRIYGRTRGRSKNKIDLEKYFHEIKKFSFTKINPRKNNILDIGTGYGETSIFLSNKYKSSNIYTCDKYINGNITLIKKIKSLNINNIFVHHGNVWDILQKLEKKNYFDSVWIFFPDPWPKKKHNKRKLLNEVFFREITHFIKNDGNIKIATDSSQYILHILRCIHAIKDQFYWENQFNLFLNYEDYQLPQTKYYKKAIFGGKRPFFFNLKKY
tara:strand:- start:1199 stop:1858 length:660 start_codon:yes stop_codon:yes gene_type:complete